MKRRAVFRTLSAAMLAPFVVRSDPTQPLQRDLDALWDRICKHEWSATSEHCVKCGVSRQTMVEFGNAKLKP